MYGHVIKNADITDDEMKLINTYSRRELKREEVYIFSVVLCDNDIDRDYERFTVESLEKLSTLFIGKTGIFDHNPTAEKQTARIISTSVESVEGRKNALGDDYFRLVARAYMPVCERNSDLILALDSGIVREVSVGCAVEKTLCSICGEELSHCSHVKGESYGGKLCYGELCDPFDAYEFSFVAVPAQKEAGVIKTFNGKESKMTDILKSIENSEAVTLNKSDSKKLAEYIESLRKQAADGAYYRGVLVSDVLRYSGIVQPEISRASMEKAVKSLSLEELKEFRDAYKKRAQSKYEVVPQLYREKTTTGSNTNTEFKI